MNNSRYLRQIDLFSLGLMLVGLMCGIAAIWLIANNNLNFVVIIPSLFAAITGAKNLLPKIADKKLISKATIEKVEVHI